MLANFRNIVYKLDIVGPEIKLTHDKESKYKTFLGVLMSLAVVILSVLSSVNLIQDVISKTNPDEVISKNISLSSFNITEDFKVFFQLSVLTNLTDGDYEPLDDDLYRINFYAVKMIKYSGSLFDMDYEAHSCENSSLLKTYNENLFFNTANKSSQNISDLFYHSECFPKNMSIEIYNRIDKDEQQMMQMSLNINYLEKYKNKVFKLMINYLQLEKNLDNISETHRLVWNSKEIMFTYNSTRYYDLVIEENLVKREKVNFINIYVPDDQSEKYQNTYHDVDSISYKETTPYEEGVGLLILSFKKAKYKVVNTIKYKGLEDFVSSFGGTLDLVHKIFSFIIEILVAPFFTTDIINKVFSFHDNVEIGKENTELILKSLEEASKIDDFVLLKKEEINRSPTLQPEKNIKKKDDEVELQEMRNLDLVGSANEINSLERLCYPNQHLLDLLNKAKRDSINYKDIITHEYFPCCLKATKRNSMLKEVTEYYYNELEIEAIIRTSRKLNHLIYTLLDEKQQNLFKLPSFNLEKEEINSHELKLPPYGEENISNNKNSWICYEDLKSIDLSSKGTKKMLKTNLSNFA